MELGGQDDYEKNKAPHRPVETESTPEAHKFALLRQADEVLNNHKNHQGVISIMYTKSTTNNFR